MEGSISGINFPGRDNGSGFREVPPFPQEEKSCVLIISFNQLAWCFRHEIEPACLLSNIDQGRGRAGG